MNGLPTAVGEATTVSTDPACATGEKVVAPNRCAGTDDDVGVRISHDAFAEVGTITISQEFNTMGRAAGDNLHGGVHAKRIGTTFRGTALHHTTGDEPIAHLVGPSACGWVE